jgi:hypothetical protein
MIKFSIIACALITTLFAGGNHVMGQLSGGDTQMTSGGAVVGKVDTGGIYNYDEVVYEHIKLRQSITHQPQEGAVVALGENITKRKQDDLAKRINAAAIQKQKANEAKAPMFPQFTEGYCYVKYDTEVEKIASYAYLSCDFESPIKRAELVVSLVPDFYAKALIAKPLYLNIIDSDRKKQRVPIESGAIMTQNKLSINIANIVNDRKIEKLIASGTYVTLNAATQQAQLYLNDLRQSRTQQTTTQSMSIAGPSTTTATNTQKPDPNDYILAGSLQLVSDLAKVIGEAVVNNLPYTFKINKDSILYADLELTNTKTLRGFDAEVPNLIKRQPAYDITTGKEQNDGTTAVPIRSSNNSQNQIK